MDAQTNKKGGWHKTQHKGVYSHLEGGTFRIRCTVKNPATGKRREGDRILEGVDLNYARSAQISMEKDLERLVNGETAAVRDPDKFRDYATRWLTAKIAGGDLRSAATHRRYTKEINCHLIPYWGDYYVNKITRSMVETWRNELGAKCVAGKLRPSTVNGWIKTFRQIAKAATFDYEAMKDPTAKIPLIDTTIHRTYTVEEPNSLLPSEVPTFMQKAWELYPRFYAFIFLMFLTGRRPCEIRPLRRRGPESDIDWNTGILHIRRSQTIGEAMNRTKTGRDLEIYLPPGAMGILKRHVESLTGDRRLASDLLFPAPDGGYMDDLPIYNAIRDIGSKAGFTKRLTPRAGRRTFNDLCRHDDAHVDDFIRESITGHATEEMKRLYSTAAQQEIRSSLDRVLRLGGFVEAAGLPAVTEAA